ncbi:type III pantothenate kinase [Alteromonas gilva]|uniref:Type III pantothenate kinase n=1 Tax=Alteromonas gilva TaxID=2987522 RepID=A0ABT5L8G9_9ALTE|nr:type III pantothenate kinase [Alteromonas gilva]MDC8832207.1 type III pantothenate kinase [Alteromonas gilva]
MPIKRQLLVDIGNTCIKYRQLTAAAENVNTVDDLAALIDHIEQTAIDSIYIANVGKPAVEETLSLLCKQQGIEFHSIKTEKDAFGIKNSYHNPQKMGVDRWLAMLGAANLTNKPFAVIDAGTAVTVDFVANGQHLGGWIAPGFHTMKKALLENTTRVFEDNTIPAQLDVANDTEKCVAMGCLASLQGIYWSAKRTLNAQFKENVIIFTGGDKKLLTSVCEGDSLSAANLVIDGLARYAEKAS